MGLSFKKELILDRTQIYPPESRTEESKLQSRLLQKLGDGAIPFTLEFPDLAPNSVLICADDLRDPLYPRVPRPCSQFCSHLRRRSARSPLPSSSPTLLPILFSSAPTSQKIPFTLEF